MKLYEIDMTIAEVLENGFAMDEETGEVIFDESDLEALQMERDAKIEGIGIWIKNLKAEAEALKAEEDALKKRRERTVKKAERLKEFLDKKLDKNFHTAKVEISFRSSAAVEISNPMDVPEDYTRKTVKIEPDKKKIRDAIAHGHEVPGAHMIKNRSVLIK